MPLHSLAARCLLGRRGYVHSLGFPPITPQGSRPASPAAPSDPPSHPTTARLAPAPGRLAFPQPSHSDSSPPHSGSTRSPPFTSVPGSSPLETWAAELNDFFPTHLSPTAASSLVVRADELKCLRCGQVHYWIPRQPRSLHWAHHPQPFLVLALHLHLARDPPARPRGATLRRRCSSMPSGPSTSNTRGPCQPPVRESYMLPMGSVGSLHLANLNPAPQSRLRSSNTLRRSGSKLTYNYDSHLLRGTCTFDAEVAADNMASDSLTLE